MVVTRTGYQIAQGRKLTSVSDWRMKPMGEMTSEERDEWQLQEVLLGHASGRFKWVDAREDHARTREPATWVDYELSVGALQAGVRPTLPYDAPLVVFSDDEHSTAEAAASLLRIGYRDIRTIPKGFPWVKQYILTDNPEDSIT